MTGIPKTVPWREDPWQEGVWVDFWSLNHVLSGLLAVPLLRWLGCSPWEVFLLASALFLGWEIYERIYDIEVLSNQFMDMVSNYLGFFIAWHWSIGPGLFGVLAVLFIGLELWGYTAYMRRKRHQ